MRKANRLPLEQLAPVLLDVPDPPVPFDWRAIFGNDHPVEMEIGFGKGLFLLTTALARTDVNFVGIEIDRKYQLYTATRLAKRRLSNVRVIKADAQQILPATVADRSLDGMHVYFPDPWWKKRHHKRRLFTSGFVTQCERVLKPGGLLHLATDVPEYFAVMQELLAPRAAFTMLPAPEEKPPAHDLDYMTNFERKARKLDKPIGRATYRRVDS